MAETKTDALTVETKGDLDPIADKSMSGIMLISALILMFTLMWALYDELFGMRPWKSVQDRFVTNYKRYLKKQLKPQAEAEKEVKASPDYQQLDSQMKAAEEEAKLLRMK